MPDSQRTVYFRIVCVAATCISIALAYTLNIPNPMIVLIIPVVYFAYADGYVGGSLSGGVSMLYALWFFSDKDALFVYSDINMQKIMTIATGLSVVVVLIGKLKAREKKYIDELASLNQRLKEHAFTDPLTFAYNRHAFSSHFGDACAAKAYGLSFAVLDLDYFKKINDKYGHDVGDKMLKHVVESIWTVIPPNSNLYRWGGEEFLLVLKMRDKTTVLDILEAVREKVETTGLEADGKELFATISIGCVGAAKSDTVQECICRADQCLYAAKATGRNRVVADWRKDALPECR